MNKDKEEKLLKDVEEVLERLTKIEHNQNIRIPYNPIAVPVKDVSYTDPVNVSINHFPDIGK